jgi:hypothetical protein
MAGNIKIWCMLIFVFMSVTAHAIAQAVSCQCLTAEAQVHSQSSLCLISDGQSDIKPGSSLNTKDFPCQVSFYQCLNNPSSGAPTLGSLAA